MRSLRVSDFPRLLGLDPEAGIRAIYRESMSPRAKLLECFLSVLEAETGQIGPVGRAHLRMAQQRAALYEMTAARIATSISDASALKGASISARYPTGLCRSFVDLDYFVASPDEVWTGAALVAAISPVTETNVSIMRTPAGDDLFIGQSWRSSDSVLEPVYRVEFSTLPFLGDAKTVPPRRGVPEDAVIRDLLLVAEEQFQRPVIGRDLIDTAVLLASLDDAAAAADAGSAWRLAPELRRLCEAVAELDLDPSGRAAAMVAGLIGPAADEEARRASEPSEQAPILYGLPLGVDPDAAVTELQEHPCGMILRSPLGAFLMVSDAEVDPETYVAACAVVGVEPDANAL